MGVVDWELHTIVFVLQYASEISQGSKEENVKSGLYAF